MAGPQPLTITVTPPQQVVLEGLLRQHSCPQALVLRARIVLAAASGQRNEPMARHLGCTPKTVRKWRARWASAAAPLAAAEADEHDLPAVIAQVLADAPRPGAPDTFTAEQIVQIIALACTPPPTPAAPWTPGPCGSWPTKRSNARLSPPFRRARSGAF
ncbi:MAG: helix-turn-helix domain-containing protein [Chloroflexota bacterium]|nr:helix-turn-helix domain-containing protein [Chloroflexota bacterium]